MLEPAEIKAALRRLCEAPDGAIDIAEAALLLAALDRPGVDLARYRDHLRTLAEEVVGAAPRAGVAAEGRLDVLRAVIAKTHRYRGDRLTYDDPQNANLMRVIDRRKGLPVALGVLYRHAGRAAGWAVEGLNFPGHFLMRIESAGDAVIFDPFEGATPLDAPAMREILRTVAGPDAALAPAHSAPVSPRQILLRLQNNIRSRAAQAGEADRVLEITERMLLIAPRLSELWRDLGRLHEAAGRLSAALGALERAREFAGEDRARHAIALDLQRLRRRLN